MIEREFKQGIPCKRNGDDGDSMLWAGLLFSTMDCMWPARTYLGEAIANCQSPNGQLWRSPARVNTDTENEFSRDMALGFLIYCASSPVTSKITFNAWVEYVKQNKKLCLNATDNRSKITPALWWMVSLVDYRSAPFIYRTTSFLLHIYLWIAAKTAPSGYRSHLVACSIYLSWLATGKKNLRTAKVLNNRNPDNPFFLWLAGETKQASKQIEYYMQGADYCSEQSEGNQWFTERCESENAHLDSCGHDFDFLVGLIKNN